MANEKWVSLNGLLYFKQKLDAIFAKKSELFSGSYNDLTDKPINATSKNDGFMSMEYAAKLDGIASNANKYIHPSHTAYSGGLYKVSVDAEGHITSALAVEKSDITALGIPGQDTTYVPATSSTPGLMASTDKSKLDGIADGAQVNIIESVKVNGTVLVPAGKAVDVSVPTKLSQLSNDATFQSKTEIQKLINDAVGKITGIDFQIVSALPSAGVKGTIYLLSNGGKNSNIYDEYIYVGTSWEKIGTTDIDLSDYYSSQNFLPITNAEIDTIFS